VVVDESSAATWLDVEAGARVTGAWRHPHMVSSECMFPNQRYLCEPPEAKRGQLTGQETG